MDYKEELRKRLPELKNLEGFPNASYEEIIELSEPPYYTACPNPFIHDYLIEYNQNRDLDGYNSKPYVGDVSEGRNDPIYLAHTYVTKVPYKAIQKYIEHYTKEGDVVLDAFGGSGMTGVAARSLGRIPIISDLSPIATYISASFNRKKNVIQLKEKFDRLYKEFKKEYRWMYLTNHGNSGTIKGEITYTVWSDVLLCPQCKTEFNFWKDGLDFVENKVKDQITCQSCSATFQKNDCEKSYDVKYDSVLNKEVKIAKQEPVLLKYKVGSKSYEKTPDQDDFDTINRIEQLPIPFWVPSDEIPDGHNTSQPIRSHGFTHVHHFFTKRTLFLLAALNEKLEHSEKVLLTSMLNRASRTVKTLLSNYFSARKGKTIGGWAGTPLTGTLYIPSISTEISILESIKNRSSSILKMESEKNRIIKDNDFFISTNSSTSLSIPDNSIDYVFTDPPFGDNKMYSELNFLSEAWIKVKTNNSKEAIVNKVQNKSEDDYKALMLETFKEYYRVLKPKRWITIEFNNSKSAIWNLIQECILKSGFIIAQVSVLDKKQGSFKQVTSANSVKSDLVISAFKPQESFISTVKSNGDGLEMNFVEEFLINLPLRPVVERTDKMLYSKAIAFFLQRGLSINYDAKTFYSKLRAHFIEEDGFWFTSDQINSYIEYKKKAKLEGIDEIKLGSVNLFVTDEKSAIVCLYHFLAQPKSFSDISVTYNQLANIQDDQVPELRDLLEENFVFEGGLYRRPKSEEEHNQITEKRQKHLWKEFETILIQAQTERKKIKEVRKEALTYGFERCYKDKRFKDILTIASKLHPSILENNGELADFVEAAEIQVDGLA